MRPLASTSTLARMHDEFTGFDGDFHGDLKEGSGFHGAIQVI